MSGSKTSSKCIRTLDDLDDWDYITFDRNVYCVVVPQKGKGTFREECRSLDEAIMVRNDYFLKYNLFAQKKHIVYLDKRFVKTVCKFVNRIVGGDDNEFCRGDQSRVTLQQLSMAIDGIVLDFLDCGKKTQSLVPRLKSVLSRMNNNPIKGRFPAVMVWVNRDAMWIAWQDANGNTLLSPDLPSVVLMLQRGRGGF